MSERAHSFPCQRCERPIAEIKDGRLLILSKHGSEKHRNEIELEELKRKIREYEERATS